MSDPADGSGASEKMAERLREMEELYMHLERMVRDLDQVVVEQGNQLAALAQKLSGVSDLVRTLSSPPSGPPVDPLEEKPPHY